MKNASRISCFASICATALMFAAGAAKADLPPLGWSVSPMSESGDTLRRDGKRLYAFCGGQTNGELISVNGVQFTAFRSFGNKGGVQPKFSVSPNMTMDKADCGSEGVDDPNYAALLRNCYWNNSGGEYTYTLQGLEAGKTYLVQMVVHANGYGSNMVTPPGLETGAHYSGTGWKYGGSIVGVFQAEGITHSFTLDCIGDKAFLNAIQVRDLSTTEPDVTEPTLGGVSAAVEGSSATITLKGVMMGTDDAGADAASYFVSCSLDETTPVVVLRGQTAATTSFTLDNLSDGLHTCEVIVRTDKDKVVSKSVSFSVNTSMVWTAEPMESAATLIRTQGRLLYAFCGGSNGDALLVNGVQFKAVKDLANVPSELKPFPVKVSPTLTMDLSNAGTESVEDIYYGKLLDKAWWYNAGGEYQCTLSGLEAGNEYLVQLVMHQTNVGDKATVAGQAPATIQLGKTAADGTSWRYGGSLVGRFTATAETYTFSIRYDGSKALINAIQVRDLSASGPEVVDPLVGSVTAQVDGKSAVLSLQGLVLGTDDQGHAASSYSVSYRLNGGAAVTALEGQTGASASFTVPNLADGDYTCEVTMTTDLSRSVTKSVSFVVNTSLKWTIAPMSAKGDTISTKGELVYAYCGCSGENGEIVTANGVDFTSFKDFGNLPTGMSPQFSISPNMTMGADSLGTAGVTDPGYRTIMNNGYWINAGGEFTVTLKGLQPKKQYLVQLIFHNNGGAETVTVPGNGTTLYVGSNGWLYGGYMSGVFVAPSSTYSFKFNSNGSRTLLNAIQVRRLSPSFVIRIR